MATKPKHQHPLIPQTTVPLLTRTVVFLGVFTILSGITGPHIISNDLVNRDGFEIYGGAGKALLFGLLALILLIQRRGVTVKLQPWRATAILWLLLSGLAITCTWIGVDKLISGASGIEWPLLVHASLLASVAFAAGGTFGPHNLRLLTKMYRRELLISLELAISFFFFLYIVYGLWKVLAIIVLKSVKVLLDIVGIRSIYFPPYTLLLSKFSIAISKYCSGIDSIALFTGLYTLVGVLDWHRFNHKRYLIVFLPALVGLFCFNIMRVFLLILAGYYINPQIAFSLFHTYAGMILFIIYSIIFWGISYKRLLEK